MASSSYSWHPHDAGKTPSWPTSANEEHQDMEPTLARWEAGLRERFSDRLSHLIWDRERIRALEEALDIVIRDDAQCPAHLSTFYRRSLLNRLTGLGPLDPLLLDDSVTEIMVNGQKTYIERQGKIERVELDFLDLEEVSDLARRLANRAGRELNTEIPLCDALLSDGSRIHCVLPPVSEEPTLTVRRMPRHTLRLDDYLAMGSMSSSLWEDISEMIAHRRNMIIAGGAGAGKTSLLRLLATAIDASERLVTIEDVRELNLPHEHTVRLEAFRQYSVNQLVINALRMRPDRIIVGEVRGPEALDLIEAMASGHPGSLCTVHSAGGDLRTVHRLARMALQRSQGISFEAMVGQILDTVDVIIYLVRDREGRRRVDTVTDVSPQGLRPRWRWDKDLADPYARVF